MAINENKGGEKSGQEGVSQAARDAFKGAGLGSQESTGGEERGYRRASSSGAPGDLTAAGIDSFFGHAFRSAPTNQSTKEFEKAFTKLLEDNLKSRPEDQVVFKVGSIDSSDSQDVAIAGITVTGLFEVNNKAHAATFVLLLDGSMDSYPTREIRDAPPVNGRPQEIQLTAGDYADQPLWNAIVQKLSSIYGSNIEFVSVGNATLPRYISAEKEEHRGKLYTSLYTAISAIYLHLQTAHGIGPGVLTVQAITNRATTSILMDLNDQPDFSNTGMPLRNDISMTMRSTVRSTVPGVPDKPVDIVKLSAYVNLLFQMPPQPTALNQRPDTRRFVPQLVLTDLTSKRSVLTPETQLLALAMAPLLDYNDQYLAAFTASATQGRPGRDFGAVGYEVNLSGVENSAPVGKEDLSKMSTADFFEMARMSLFPELHVALAIDESGALTWLNSMFLDAAVNPNGDGYNSIVQAADNLTGGIFSKLWNGGIIARSTGTRYHVGYYFDDNNEMRDLQDIDPLWMLNRCGSKYIESYYEFCDTFLGDSSPDAQLVARWNIITKYVRNATLIGYGQIVEMDPDFLVALIQAIKSAGLSLRANNALIDFQGARGRASFQGSPGLNKSVINATLNAGGGERRGPSFQGGVGLNSWARRY
jgi:hypothetical protein